MSMNNNATTEKVELVPQIYLIRSYSSPKLSVSMSFPETGRTRQEFVEESDINNIMARYLKTGTIDWVNKYDAQHLDCSGLDFQSAQDQIVQAKTMFAELPAQLRDTFQNDPVLFVDFCSDPANYAEMDAMGLLRPVDERQTQTQADPLPQPQKPPKSAKTPPAGQSDGGEGGTQEPAGP